MAKRRTNADAAAAREFLAALKKQRGLLTAQQIKTLRGQAVSGDVEAATRGLRKLLKRPSP